jgi:O-antigen ligase
VSKKTCEIILKIGVFLSLLSFFIIVNNWYYPFITGKQIYFNILLELLIWFWFYLILKYPETRPRRSWITWSILVWLGVMLVSAIFGVDFNLSFWGDTERMLGIFSLLHFFALYLIIITVFKSKTDWLLLLNGSVAAAVIVAVYAFLSPSRPGIGNVNMMSNISTLGNATYVAGVMLFNLYFIIYLWKNSRLAILKLWYLVAAVLIGAAFYYAHVFGSTAGLITSLLVCGLVLGWLHKNKGVKIASFTVAGILMAVLVLSVILALNHSPLFGSKITSINARFYAWQAGWKGFLERPVLGWGYGNFAAPFDKYFKAGLYHWTPNEEFYDHAHDVPLEMLATAGILGLIAYLAIFVAVAGALFKTWRRQTIKPLVLAVVVGIFVSYFIHNLAVFDSLANLVCWMIALAFVFWLTGNDADAAPLPSIKFKAVNLNSVVFGLLICSLIYYGNIRSAQMMAATIGLARSWYTDTPADFLNTYQKTFSYHTPLDRDVRTFVISLVLDSPNRLAGVSQQDLDRFFTSLFTLSQENLQLAPHDYFFLNQRAQLLGLVGSLAGDKQILAEALQTADQAIAWGGEHLPAYFTKTDIYLNLKDYQQADATMRQALALWPDNQAVYCRLAYLELKYNLKVEPAALWSNLDNCLDKGDVSVLTKGEYLLPATAHYEALKDQTRLKKLQAIMLVK